MYGGGGTEKRTGTLPIFTRKRPRVALMAFSNSQSNTNSGHTSQQESRLDRKYFSVSNEEANTSYNCSGKEAGSWSTYKLPRGYVAPAATITPAQPRSNPHWSTSVTRDVHVKNEVTVPDLLKHPPKPLVQEAESNQSSQLMKSVHLLTATSQGLQYWSRYQQQVTLMFEVFGTLSSQIERGEMGSRKFTIQAVDGPLKCMFWEIDYKIPATLICGHICRVVGKWDMQNCILKCVSIRPAGPKEWSCVKSLVATSDKYMRQMASSLNEI